jgi:hypothetical protein
VIRKPLGQANADWFGTAKKKAGMRVAILPGPPDRWARCGCGRSSWFPSRRNETFRLRSGRPFRPRTKTCPFTPTSRPESTRLTDSIGYEGPTEMTVTSGLVTDKELPRFRTLGRFSLLIRETLPSQPVDLILGDFATTSILAQCLDYQTHIQKPLNCFPEPGPSCKG